MKERCKMVTPEAIRLDVAKVDALMEAFEVKYLHFLDIGKEEFDERDRGALAFYALRDLLKKMEADAEELCGHMEVCDAIMAADKARKEAQKK